MTDLSKEHCEACRIDAPMVTDTERAVLIKGLSAWEIVDKDGILQLFKEYAFKNFVDAIAFANNVGDLAEKEGHHPALLVEWGKVTVRWWSHKIGGLHRNDFILAAKTDEL